MYSQNDDRTGVCMQIYVHTGPVYQQLLSYCPSLGSQAIDVTFVAMFHSWGRKLKLAELTLHFTNLLPADRKEQQLLIG